MEWTPCCDGWKNAGAEVSVEWDDGKRWGDEGFYFRTEGSRHPLFLITFCPFCGTRIEPEEKDSP